MTADSSSNAGAFAVVRGEEPQVFLAENAEVLARALALHLVAELPAAEVTSQSRLEEMRSALLEERWADALVVWIEETGVAVDVYAEAPRSWHADDLDLERATLEIRMAPLFAD